MAYKNRFRPKGERQTSKVTAPSVRKMAKAKKASKRKREDFSQTAARIVKEATKDC
jgi:hypothetical protein